MKDSYTQAELNKLLNSVTPRNGWDFSSMNTQREPVPWDYIEVVQKYLKLSDTVLDIGTGGGERFIQLASHYKEGVGVDIDPDMVTIASQNAKNTQNVSFFTSDEQLADVDRHFDVIINRHAPFNITAIKNHLKPGGIFITQQVGEKNMQNVKAALNQNIGSPVISRAQLEADGLSVVDFKEYDVEYVVKDIESLVFWLNALDMLHADLVGQDALKDAGVLNSILEGNVNEKGFITNEHRYFAIAEYVS